MDCDVLVIGGGIVGLATARELLLRNRQLRVIVLEKEGALASHQTGRNSGVIHAGVYYAPGSLKARFCRQGVSDTIAFCKEHNIAYEQCGKLLVATDEPEMARMAALQQRFGDVRVSAAYRFPSVGFDGADFVNLAAIVETDLAPEVLNDWLHALEDRHGRRRDVPRFSDRTLDIDIVLFGDQVLSGSGNLQVPRDELRHAFVLRPLAEIAPETVVPTDGRTLRDLWRQHADYERTFENVELA